MFFFFFSSRRRHTRFKCDWSSDVCSSDLTSNIDRHDRGDDSDWFIDTNDYWYERRLNSCCDGYAYRWDSRYGDSAEWLETVVCRQPRDHVRELWSCEQFRWQSSHVLAYGVVPERSWPSARDPDQLGS